MIKLLYLLAGVSLSQTISEINSLVRKYVDDLKKTRESVARYRENPALEIGSKEAHRAMMIARHRADVAPEVRRLSKRMLTVRLIPVVLYALVTVAVCTGIVYLELAEVVTPIAAPRAIAK